jgi:hypothetical protein
MAQTTQRLVVEVTPGVAELLTDVSEGHNVSKRAVVECAIEHYARTLGYAQKETTQ